MTSQIHDLLNSMSDADLALPATRLILADLLTDADREEESDLCRDLRRGVSAVDGRLVKVFTGEEIADAVNAYCDHHAITEDEMMVEENHNDNLGVIGFRLSRDIDGHSHGCNETFGVWK